MYIVFNSKLITKIAGKKKRNYNKFFLCYSGLDAIYKCFLYFIFNILVSSYISAVFFISVVWKLSLNLRPQRIRRLKGVYGLKFFYLAENKKLFFTQSYTNGKNVIVCGHENSNADNDHCASCYGKYSHNKKEEWVQCPALYQQGFNEQCFYN